MKRFSALLLTLLLLSLLSAAAETAQPTLLPDPVSLAPGLTQREEAVDYGAFWMHFYEGNEAVVSAAVDAYTAYLVDELGMEEVLPVTGDSLPESGDYAAAYRMPGDELSGSTFAMRGDFYQVDACHVMLMITLNGDYSLLNICHSPSLPCPLETIVPVEETAEIQWYKMGTSGESFYYGQTDEHDDPAGFIVYESNQGSTNYGINMGGYQNGLWDGVCIAINRERGRVDSINLITYETGNPRYSTRYFSDGTITYATYEGGMPKVRYDRAGDQYTTQNFYKFSMTWGGENEVSRSEIQPEWGMGYASFALDCEEQKLENGLHVGTYLLTGVTDEGKTEEILHLEATPDGSVEYTLRGESWRYDYAANTYTQLNAPAQ